MGLFGDGLGGTLDLHCCSTTYLCPEGLLGRADLRLCFDRLRAGRPDPHSLGWTIAVRGDLLEGWWVGSSVEVSV